MSTVISVENLGKKYTLHHQQRESYRALRDVLTDGVASIGQKLLHPFRKFSTVQQAQEEFWALKNISFEVKQGDRIGIIGRNGAGKSTLLKILSRITEPTTGKVKIKGRVASLLEVGTGFHPELTGRENIYLNGAILGMSRVEIKKKFDEIVDFAEIEKFLDTPVKRYSSGMYVRLAFAVAAHLEPEILVVDEVLSVGDLQFQKKCLGKMEDVGEEGRTVLFVSHNLSQIKRLCARGIQVNNGILAHIGDMESVTSHYLTNGIPDIKHEWRMKQGNDSPLAGPVQPIAMRIVDGLGNGIATVDRGQGKVVFLVIEFDLLEQVNDLTLGYSLFDEQENHLYRCLHTDAPPERWPNIKNGRNILRTRLPIEWLNEGRFTLVLDASIYKKRWLFSPNENKKISLCLEVSGRETSSVYWQDRRMGLMAPVIPWECLGGG